MVIGGTLWPISTIHPDGFERLTSHIVQWSKAAGNLSIVSVLEGGYNCEALTEDVSVHLDALNQ